MCAKSAISHFSFAGLLILCRSGRLLLRNFDKARLRRCPVVFRKLSKVLNQENALGAPGLGCDFCSPQAPSRGAGMLRTGVTRRCWDHRIITPTCADAFPVVGGSAR